MKKSLLSTLVLCLLSFALTASAGFEIDRSAMSDRYWETWNDAEQAKIDADIEANRKADAEFSIDAPPGTEVTVELLDHEFRFGAHIFNYNQLGKTEYNDAYKASYGKGGIFNQATVAFYWDCYEPVPGRLRSGGDYEDTERFWNSISRDEAMEHPFWRRPAAAPVIDFLKAKDVSIHGHILIWGLARPFWLYDWYCPENEKRQLDALGIPRRTSEFIRENGDWSGGYGDLWRKLWGQAFARHGEAEIGALAPTYVKNLRRLFRKRVADVAKDFGDVVDSWDVVNESSVDWVKYRQSRTGLPIWKSVYGAMPGDYPLDALLDAGELMSPKAKLAINDWNIAPAFLDQVNDLEKNGARVDIVGCQMHIFNTNDCKRLALGATNVNWVGTPQTIQARLDMMAKTGRPIHISEITITSPGPGDDDRMIQAILTRNIYRKWFSHKSVMGITWWNTVDGGGVKGEPLVSGLFTPDMKRKPAYDALDDLINREWKTRTTAKVIEVEKRGGGGRRTVVSFRGFRGKYRLSWTGTDGVKHVRETWVLGNRAKDGDAPVIDCSAMSVTQYKPGKGTRPIKRFRLYGPFDKKDAGVWNEAEIAAKYGEGTMLAVGADGWADINHTKLELKSGEDPAYAAYAVMHVTAPQAMTAAFAWRNDWFGAISVNGAKPVFSDGEWASWSKMPVGLRKGDNTIVFRTSPGSTSKWKASFALDDPTGELNLHN